MSQRFKAIYENGVLRPLGPLDLPEHSEVEIRLQRIDVSEIDAEHRIKTRQALIDAGLSLPPSGDESANSEPITLERREELSRLFSSEKPLSDLISEDREGR